MGNKQAVRDELLVTYTADDPDTSSVRGTTVGQLPAQAAAPKTGDKFLIENSDGRNKKVDASLVINIHAYAGLLLTDGSTAQTLDTTAVKLTGFTADMASANCTPAHATDDITIIEPGVYAVTMQISFIGNLNETYTFEARIDGAVTGIKLARKIGTGTDVGSGSLTGLITLAAGEVVSLFAAAGATSAAFEPKQMQFLVHKVSS